MKKTSTAILALCAALACTPSSAAGTGEAPAGGDGLPSGDVWRLFLAPLTVHFGSGEDHRYVILAGAERQSAGGFVVGGSVFRNTFAQPSAYAYAGRRFSRLFGYEPLFLEATAGVLYGYRGKYENHVPFNHHGFAPGAVAALGWQFGADRSVQVNVLGLSALMLQFNMDLH